MYRPVCCEVEAESLHELGDGYKGYLIKAPNGKTFVAEEETGALVGSTVARVKKDIKTGDKKLMKEQIETSREDSKRAEEVTTREWWGSLSCLYIL